MVKNLKIKLFDSIKWIIKNTPNIGKKVKYEGCIVSLSKKTNESIMRTNPKLGKNFSNISNFAEFSKTYHI